MVQSRCNTYWQQCEDRRDTTEVIVDFVSYEHVLPNREMISKI